MKISTWIKYYILNQPCVVQYDEHDFRVVKFNYFSGETFRDKVDDLWWGNEDSIKSWCILTCKEDALLVLHKINKIKQQKSKKVIHD
jgi:hypothetical protein